MADQLLLTVSRAAKSWLAAWALTFKFALFISYPFGIFIHHLFYLFAHKYIHPHVQKHCFIFRGI
jgi:hypothetical protein